MRSGKRREPGTGDGGNSGGKSFINVRECAACTRSSLALKSGREETV